MLVLRFLKVIAAHLFFLRFRPKRGSKLHIGTSKFPIAIFLYMYETTL